MYESPASQRHYYHGLLDADVLNIPRAASAGTVSSEDVLEKLFDIEKDLVFRTIRDVLGVELTPAEEQQIRENRAGNILAFLAYGRGLRARDQGDYAAALAAFQQALAYDPGFDAAAAATSQTESMSEASGTSTSQVASTGGAGAGTQTTGTLAGASEAVNPTPTTGTLDKGSSQTASKEQAAATTEKRDAVQESQGQESVTKTAKAQIRIVIKRPGGGDQ